MDSTKGSAPLEAVSDDSTKSVDGNETQKSVDYAKYQKLLGEKKKEQSEKEALKTQLEEYANEKLHAQGKYKELNDGLAKQLNEAKAKERSLHKVYSEKVIRQQFVTEALKQGCVDPEAAYKLCDLNGIEVKDDFSLDIEGLTSQLSDLQKTKTYLFKKEVSAPKDSPPSNLIKKQSVDALTTEQLYAELAKKL